MDGSLALQATQDHQPGVWKGESQGQLLPAVPTPVTARSRLPNRERYRVRTVRCRSSVILRQAQSTGGYLAEAGFGGFGERPRCVRVRSTFGDPECDT